MSDKIYISDPEFDALVGGCEPTLEQIHDGFELVDAGSSEQIGHDAHRAETAAAALEPSEHLRQLAEPHGAPSESRSTARLTVRLSAGGA